MEVQASRRARTLILASRPASGRSWLLGHCGQEARGQDGHLVSLAPSNARSLRSPCRFGRDEGSRGWSAP
jgi:hypothetical protein